MKKLLILQSTLLLLCVTTLSALAQDSVKKTATTKPAAYPAKTGYYKPRYYRKPGDTAVHAYQKPATDTNHKTVAAPAPDAATDKSLNGQYQYLLTKVYYYQQPLLNAFHKSIMDTLQQARGTVKTSQAKITAQAKLIDSLQNEIKSNDQTLSASNSRVDSINVFGIVLPKSTYNIIMWGLVVVFGVIAAIVIVRSGGYAREAKYRVQLYNELDEEYKTYKLKANEKEKKLARELQTERNRIDDLLGRG